MADAINNQFSTAYRFVFTAVRGDGRSIQLGEVRLYDSDGNAVAISSASNPDGDNPPANLQVAGCACIVVDSLVLFIVNTDSVATAGCSY